MDASTEPKTAVTPQQRVVAEGIDSPFQLYRRLAVGRGSLRELVWYELCTFMGIDLPGILGYGVRSLLYPSLFHSCQGRPAIGRGVTLRNPGAMRLGRKVMVDDGAVLDARGDGAEISLGEMVSIGRYTTLAAKEGSISLSAGVNVGSYCRIATQSSVHIEESVLIAAYCYIGPGNHQRGDQETPLIERPMDIRGGVRIGKHAWIGARATILDGVTIGEGAIVGAHSVVLKDVAPGEVVAGAPARPLRGEP